MKILLVNNFFYRRAGTETYMFALADLLRAHGHEVVFFSMHHPRNLPCPQSAYFVEYIDYAVLNEQKNLRNGLRVLRRSIYSPQAGKKLRALLEAERPDVAHIQNLNSHLTPSILPALTRAGVPAVWTLHDLKMLCPEGTLLSHEVPCEACRGGRFYHCALKKCKKNSRAASAVAAAENYVLHTMNVPGRVHRLLAPSRYMREKFISFGWSPDHVAFLRNFLPALPGVAGSDRGYGLYLGSLLPLKGVHTLLDALKERPDLPVRILGAGGDEALLKARADREGLRQVEFMGHLEGEELDRTIRECAYGIVPSRYNENCPYSVMEMMAHGKPVVASRIGGIPELVEDGHTGLLFEPGNASDLREKLSRMHADAAGRARMGGAARERAEAMFKPEPHYEALMEHYRQAMASRAV